MSNATYVHACVIYHNCSIHAESFINKNSPGTIYEKRYFYL